MIYFFKNIRLKNTAELNLTSNIFFYFYNIYFFNIFIYNIFYKKCKIKKHCGIEPNFKYFFLFLPYIFSIHLSEIITKVNLT